MSSLNVQLQLGCELNVPAGPAQSGQRPALWLARPATLGNAARLFTQRWLQTMRLRRWHSHPCFLLCHEPAQCALGLTVKHLGA